MNNDELAKQVRDLKELKLMAEELAIEIAHIEDVIKAEMTALNVNELEVDIFKIRWTPVKTPRFDKTAFKKVYSELYNQFTKIIETKRFSIA